MKANQLPAVYTLAAKHRLCLQVGSDLVLACGHAGVMDLEAAKRQAEGLASAGRRVAVPPGGEVPDWPRELDACLHLGFGAGAIKNNALLLAVREMNAQLEALFAEVAAALVDLADAHRATLTVVVSRAKQPHVTSLGGLACAWLAQLRQLQQAGAVLQEQSLVVRYRMEEVSILGDRAGQVTKLLAVGLGLGHNPGQCQVADLAVDWALWLLKVINACAVIIGATRQMGQDGEDVREMAGLLAQVNDGLGIEVLGSLLHGKASGTQREWECLEQLREVTAGGLAWVHALACREYSVAQLRELALGAGRVALAAAAIKVLTAASDGQAAAQQVAAATRRVAEQGGDLLELLATEQPAVATALMRLAEPVAVLGPLPDWVGEVVAQARLDRERALPT